MKKTAQTVEENRAKSDQPDSPANTQQNTESKAERIKPWRWKPGQSGNPNGRPKNDVARDIAQAIFTNNADVIYGAFAKALLKGNAYAFDVVASRAFGKLSEKVKFEAGDELIARLLQGRKRASGK